MPIQRGAGPEIEFVVQARWIYRTPGNHFS
jgi:hypothetical protein